MAETHTISALRQKRAEISGHIHVLEKKVQRLRASFDSIRNDMCDRTSPSRSGTTIFPGETVIKGGFTSDEYPAFLKSEWDSLTGDKVVVVYGCVDYRFPEGKERHQSRFANAVGIKRKIGTLDRISASQARP